ncbi:hypothetical protein F53441_7361 [Fusarium austroafricanum]|uniref:Mating factor alpha n=1 Tax=Fusarium austroafricanum TaxID=2364996 RepID=A0A8H4KFD6_9HYPO|nr:hypothetical protein F53441_7361 [Fusarium austroafricanum]
MKTLIPITLAFLSVALAAPVQPEDTKRSEAQSPDILYNNQAGWGKRSEAQSPDILYNNQAGWGKRDEGKRSEAQSPDILYNNQAGWGKRRKD